MIYKTNIYTCVGLTVSTKRTLLICLLLNRTIGRAVNTTWDYKPGQFNNFHWQKDLVKGLDPTCNLCGMGEETPWHLLHECPVINHHYTPPADWEVTAVLKRIYQLHFMEVPEYHRDLYQ